MRVRAGLADLPQRAILVLDHFQEITAPAVLESLNHLIDHQPPNLRLVLVTLVGSDICISTRCGWAAD